LGRNLNFQISAWEKSDFRQFRMFVGISDMKISKNFPTMVE